MNFIIFFLCKKSPGGGRDGQYNKSIGEILIYKQFLSWYGIFIKYRLLRYNKLERIYDQVFHMKCKVYHVRLKLTRVINLSACILEYLLIKDRTGNAIG